MVRLIGRIARTELLIMFCSPMGWVLVVAFAVHSSTIYFRVLDLPLYHKMQGYEGIYPLTESIFTQAYAVCWQITQVMFLYVPLLTMGLISREVANGSIRLLMSSPVRTSEMVIGKFLAVAAYCLVFALILLALLAANVFVVENIDIAPVLVAIFGVYILTCTYGAIGLFMSSLTQYQLAAAMYTFAALALLMFIGSIGQEIPFLQDFNYWISLTGRVDYFRNGLIVSKHLAYFLIIIGVFIFLTITKLSASQSARPVHINIAKVATVIIIAVTLGLLSSAPSVNAQWDATRTGSQSLAPASVEIMQAISGPWKVVTYVNLLDQNARMGLPSEKNIDALNFEDYVVENPALEMEYIHYYGPSENEQIFLAYPGLEPNEIAKILAFEWNLDFSDVLSVNELPGTIDFGFERYRYVRAIEWNGKTEVLRVFDDSLVVPTETEISTTLKRLVDGATNVGVAFGQGERSVFQNGILDYSQILSNVSHRDALINQGFSFREIQFGGSVPSDIDILLIADPKMPYTPLQLEILEEYIGKGGNVAIALEPEGDALGSLLLNLGVSRKDSPRLRDEHRVDEVATVPTMELNALGFSATRLNAHKPILLSGGAGFHASTDSPFEVVPLLLEEGGGEVAPLAVALRRAVNGKEQRIFVVGDADFMSNSVLAIERKSNNNNQEFIEWVFRWLSQDEYPIDLGRPEFIDRRLLIDSTDIPRMKLVAYGVAPGLILLFAARLMIRRRTR